MSAEQEVLLADTEDHSFAMATEGSVKLMAAMAGQSENLVRDPGFILTVDNIVDIKTYVWHARSFPRDDEGIRVYIGEGDFEKGLHLQDFKKTFTVVRDHADTWDPLEQSIRTVGTNLDIFAGEMATQAKLIGEVLTDLKGNHAELKDLPKDYAGLQEAISKIDHPQRERFLLNKDGDLRKTDVLGAIESMSASVIAISATTRDIQSSLNDFTDKMQKSVIPEIKLRKEALDNSQMSEKTKEQKNKVETLKLDLEESSRQYREKVRESVNSLAKGLTSGGVSAAGLAVSGLAGLAMAIYYGVDAENERARRNDLQAQVDKEVLLLSQMDLKQGKMQALQVKFNTLQNIALVAEAGLLNLRTVWDAISLLVSSSKAKAEKAKDSISLIALASRVEEIAKPWTKIKVEAHSMLTVFKEADKAYIAKEGALV